MATWTIRTHYKKSCEQHEYFYNRNIKGAEIIVKDQAISAFEVIQRISDTSLIAANILEISKHAFTEQKSQNQKKWVSDFLDRLRFWRRTFS
jgi:hypothetical protein